MTRKAYGALGIIAIASTLRIATASAGPCAGEITEFRSSLSQDKNGEPTFVGTAPQSIGAQLEHQPTPASVEQAEARLQKKFAAAMARAKRYDAQGNRLGCTRELAKAKRMYIL